MYALATVLKDLIDAARWAGEHGLARRPAVLAGPGEEKAIAPGAVGHGRLVDATVTDADRECQEVVLSALAQRYPDANCLVEETTAPDEWQPAQTRMYANDDSPHAFAVDPLDGTANYAMRGLGAHPNHRDNWAVCIGYLFERRMQVAVMWFPETQELVWAVRGTGAYEVVNGVEARLDLRSPHPWRGPLSLRHWQSLAALGMDSELPNTTLTCTARELVDIARGRGGQFVGGARTKVVDAGVGRLIVLEAGGVSCDLLGYDVETEPADAIQPNGERLAFYDNGLIIAATRGEIDAVLALVAGETQ